MNLRELFKHWDEVRHELYRALDMLTDDQLAFVPREGLWSLGEVARHIANTEAGWLHYIAMRELDRLPPTYAAADYPTIAAVKTLLAETHDRTNAYLETLTLDDLNRQIDIPGDESGPLYWIIWHVIDHEVHHRGEIFLMLGLMGLEAPDI